MSVGIQHARSSQGAFDPLKAVMRFLIRYNLLVIFAALVILSSIVSPNFLSLYNIFNVLRQAVPLLFVSLGMLLVIVTAGIDLSVGAIAGIGGMLVASLLPMLPFGGTGEFALIVDLVICIVAGGVFGLVNGVLVGVAKYEPFIVTLATMTIGRGIVYLLTNGEPAVMPIGSSITTSLSIFGSSGTPVVGIPWPVVLGGGAIIVFHFVMKHTVFGRVLLAIGSNETAVRLAGLRPAKVKVFAYAICGVLASIAGIIVTSRTTVGTPTTGIGLELDAIAAVVIGGAPLMGGRGTAINTVIGVLILSLINNVMLLLSVPIYPQEVVKGAIILAAVGLQKITSGGQFNRLRLLPRLEGRSGADVNNRQGEKKNG